MHDWRLPLPLNEEIRGLLSLLLQLSLDVQGFTWCTGLPRLVNPLLMLPLVEFDERYALAEGDLLADFTELPLTLAIPLRSDLDCEEPGLLRPCRLSKSFA